MRHTVQYLSIPSAKIECCTGTSTVLAYYCILRVFLLKKPFFDDSTRSLLVTGQPTGQVFHKTEEVSPLPTGLYCYVPGTMPGTTVDRLQYLDCWIPGVENSFLTVVHIAQQVAYRRRYDGYESLRTAVFDANPQT